jgi:hypothetical protein
MRLTLPVFIVVALVANGIGALTRSEWGRGASLLTLAVIMAIPALVIGWYIAGLARPGKLSHPHLPMSANDTQWYWCLDHNAAEPADNPCPPDRRWGPYPSREAAEHWKEQVAARNEEWDAADKEWEEG